MSKTIVLTVIMILTGIFSICTAFMEKPNCCERDEEN